MESHLDKHLRWDQLTLLQQLNVKVDRLAQCALLASVRDKVYINISFPFAQVEVFISGEKVTGDRLYREGYSFTLESLHG